MSLHDALAGMRAISQWFLWRLEWDALKQKYTKRPACGDASLPANWMSYEQARASLSEGYALGFWMTADCGYWFFDLDAVGNPPSAFAMQMVAAFPGALVEWSSSMKGLHIIGRTAAPIGEHRKRDVHGLSMEFYTEDRGIAFGLTGEATGSADSLHDAMVAQLVAEYFPPRAEAAGGGQVRPEWRGPADDDALIAKALAARVSAEVAFGGKASFGQLWRGECEKDSSSDMALASHLAFWTGCDAERMERLMWRSGLVRDKWKEHRTYLRGLTIANAIAGCSNVYQEPQRDLAIVGEVYGTTAGPGRVTDVISNETAQRVRELLDKVTACGTIEEMHNDVIPMVRDAGVPGAYQEQLVRVVNEQLSLWKAKLPVGKLRMLMFPPAMVEGMELNAPEWLMKHCYVKEGDFFFDCSNGSQLTYQGFIAEYSRLMPVKDGGGRENPVEWAFTRWGIRTVHKLAYRPDQEQYFEWDGFDYVNSYSHSSVPPVATQYTPEGIEGITAFRDMLWDICARRQAVFDNLLWWIAHNVQNPGRKIRWSPLIKGTHGDGKSLLTVVMRSVMGYRNVGVTGNATLRANGGFQDWQVGCAVNIIEEIHLTGKERHTLYNSMKECIANDVMSINAKGGKAYKTWNITNHLATSNHNDAIPLEAADRRWLIIFTPWASLSGMYRYCGLTPEQWKARTKAIDRAWKSYADQLRAWLLSIQIGAEFDIDGSAMSTEEKYQMMASSQDDAESVTASIVAQGAHGVNDKVISSSCLSNMLKISAAIDGFEVPRTSNLNHMLTRMGYAKLPKQLKWDGKMHTFWVRDGFTDDPRTVL